MLKAATPLEFYESARSLFHADPTDYRQLIALIDLRGWTAELEDPIEHSFASKSYPESPNPYLPIYGALLVEVGFAMGFMHACLGLNNGVLPVFQIPRTE